MPLRASWKGYLRLSLVSTPVQAVSAVISGDGKIHLNQLHASCHNRIRYAKVCPVHGEVPNNEIVFGYEHSKGQYVILEDDDVDRLRTEADKEINLDTFVDPTAIDLRYFDGRTFYLAPDGPMGLKPYAVLLRAMAERQCFGIGRAVFSGREQLVVVRAMDGVIALEMLHYDSQLRPLDTVRDETTLPDVSKQELRLADKLIEVSTSKRFDLSEYVDTYTDKLREAIEAKVAGKEVISTPNEVPAPVINLMDALRRSVAQGKRAAPKRSTATPRKAAQSKRKSRTKQAG